MVKVQVANLPACQDPPEFNPYSTNYLAGETKMLLLLLQFFLFSDGKEPSVPIPDSIIVKLKENYTNNIENGKAGSKLYRQFGINVELIMDHRYLTNGKDTSIAYEDVPVNYFIADTFFVCISGPNSLMSGMRYFYLPYFEYIDLISLKSLKVIHRFFVWGQVRNLIVLGDKIYAENSNGKVRVIEIPDQ